MGGEVDEHGLVLRRLQLVPQEVLWEEEKHRGGSGVSRFFR